MVYDKVIHGKFVDLRSISVEDAEFSYEIRADKNNRDTVGQLAESVQAQREYIIKQMNTPGDYYFLVIDKSGKKIGLTGVYNIHNGVGELGREVNIAGPVEAMETTLLLNDFCRNILELKKVCYVIYANNTNNISNAKKRGGKFIKMIKRGGHDALYFEDELTANYKADVKLRNMIDKLADKYSKSAKEV